MHSQWWRNMQSLNVLLSIGANFGFHSLAIDLAGLFETLSFLL